ncbi:zinc ribbon domain-containing protein [Paenibacillus turicensis]|uniref:zinc ribbon domain-containing protein n=1 Tax=Paenibacillus turicensis TaxID=160487 RepID=UPI003D2BF6A7
MQQFCQSCGMPLQDKHILGTEANGAKSEEYCSYCYQDGKFTAPNMAMEEMIEIGVSALQRDGMEEQQARAMLSSFLPNLKRWRSESEALPSLPIKQCVLPSVRLIGISARTTNEKEMKGEGCIAKLWEQFWSEGVPHRIPSYESHHPVYGCYIDYEQGAEGEYTIFIGIKVDPAVELPEGSGLKEAVIPDATYAIFQAGEEHASVAYAWQHIWKWAESGQSKRTYTGDFEVYEQGKPTLIYIAVQP